jgi:arylsulfatase A-like enzyme
VASLVLLAGCQPASEPAKAKKKNVLIIVLDAVRQNHVSTFGYFRPTTPNIDWLAVNGLAIRNVIPTGCSATVSLTSLFTSKAYTHSQMESATTLREDNMTLAEVFGPAGYRTAAFVASPVLARAANFDQGFATYKDFQEGGGGYITADVPIKAAIDDLKAHADDPAPFFMYIHLREPHPPWNHETQWLGGKESATSFFDKDCMYLPTADELAFVESHQRADLIAKYDGALHFADEQIGVLIKELRSLNRIDNTVIAVTTSHGIELLDRFSGTHAYNPFDEVVRTFAVIFDRNASFKDAIAGSLQARNFDIGPTLMGLAGVDLPSGVEGVDLLQSPKDLPQRTFVHCVDADVVRTLEYKLIAFDFSRLRDMKLNPPAKTEEGLKLFALRADAGETADVKNSDATELGRMQEALDEFRKTLGNPPPATGHVE